MKKPVVYTEVMYILGILTLTMGCAFMERADYGLSMVVAPAYLLSLKLSEFSPFFTFGVLEYMFQAVLLILMVIVIRRFRFTYLFSFLTAVIYGYTLNGTMFLVSLMPGDSVPFRLILFTLGMLLCSFGVSCMLHTYFLPEVYELIVKEVPVKFGWNITVFKTLYDIASCLLAVALSFAFCGMWVFEGVNWGTLVCSFVNGFLIGRISSFMERRLIFKDALSFRRFFTALPKEKSTQTVEGKS